MERCQKNGSVPGEERWARPVDRRTGRPDATLAADTGESQWAAETAGAAEIAGATEIADATETAEIARARLEGVTLAAREMAHLLHNDLCAILGYLEILQAHPDLPAFLEQPIAEAMARAETATDKIEQLRRVRRVELKETPFGPSLDLERSQ